MVSKRLLRTALAALLVAGTGCARPALPGPPAPVGPYTTPASPEASTTPSSSPSPSTAVHVVGTPKAAPTTRRPTPTTVKTTGGASTVRPGAFCAPVGAHGTYNGITYTCKGPGQARWRR